MTTLAATQPACRLGGASSSTSSSSSSSSRAACSTSSSFNSGSSSSSNGHSNSGNQTSCALRSGTKAGRGPQRRPPGRQTSGLELAVFSLALATSMPVVAAEDSSTKTVVLIVLIAVVGVVALGVWALIWNDRGKEEQWLKHPAADAESGQGSVTNRISDDFAKAGEQHKDHDSIPSEAPHGPVNRDPTLKGATGVIVVGAEAIDAEFGSDTTYQVVV